MKLRQRIFYLRKHGGKARVTRFGEIAHELQKSIEACIGAERAHDSLRGWPNVNWQDNGDALTVTPWKSARDPDLQLLDIRLVRRKDAQTYTLTIHVGAKHPNEIIIQEVCRLAPDVSQPPLDAIPDVLGFLVDYDCMDEDQYYTGRVYQVAWKRIYPFGDFVLGTDSRRELPIVLISHDNESSGYLVAPKELAERLFGLAHVMKLESGNHWSAANPCLRNHQCFNGAVRVYLPGFRDSDPPDTSCLGRG